MDLRGHGRSGWEPPWTLETHVADLAETATVYAVERATWMGFSFGGRLVAELALHNPRLVDRLVAQSPGCALGPEELELAVPVRGVHGPHLVVARPRGRGQLRNRDGGQGQARQETKGRAAKGHRLPFFSSPMR